VLQRVTTDRLHRALLDVQRLRPGESVDFTTELPVDPTTCTSFAAYAVGLPEALPSSAPPPTFPSPLLDATLASAVSDVPGFQTQQRSAGKLPWFVFELPDSVRAHPMPVTSIDGDVGTLIVVEELDFADYSARRFDEEVEIVADIDPAGEELVVLTNSALPAWQNVGGVPVIVATVPEQLPTHLASQGLAEATVSDKTVRQDPTRLVLVEDDLVIRMTGNDSTAFAAIRPFIDRFVARLGRVATQLPVLLPGNLGAE
jgi:hypothetical protein